MRSNKLSPKLEGGSSAASMARSLCCCDLLTVAPAARGHRAAARPLGRGCKVARAAGSGDAATGRRQRNRRLVYSWEEARTKARSLGFRSKEEFEEYDCPGAYGLPKKPDEVYALEWEGWGDFLGTMYSYEKGRERARALKCRSEGSWRDARRGGGAWFDARVPARPDLYYVDEWRSWDDWLGTSSTDDSHG